MNKCNYKLSFYGGAGTVTGANYVLSENKPGGKSVMVDCGLEQGGLIFEKANYDPFSYDPSSVSALFVTHAHIDHVGRIPKLVHEGFKGRIISTAPTKDIAELVLRDSLGVMRKEIGEKGKVLYEEADIVAALDLWETVDYGKQGKIGDFEYAFRDAGHILGSAMIEIKCGGKKLVFTGDLGNSPAPLLRDTEKITDANYLIMETVYGDRNHEGRKERRAILEDVIEDTVIRGGTLMIPAFSVERTQELLFEINEMVENGRIPAVPMYLDSPLAIAVTKIYRKYESLFNAGASKTINSGDDVFNFKGLKYIEKTEESRKVDSTPGPKIIIAGSGMSNGGRIIHHEKRFLSDPKSSILLAGYQAAGTLGRQLQDGAKYVNILGDSIPVEAKIVTIAGYSAHKDADGLIDFVSNSIDTLERVFCVMGEPHAALTVVQRVRDYLGINAVAPDRGDVFEIETNKK